MTGLLKQRLIGAIVLISLGIIFIPMLLTGKGNILEGDMQSNVPPKPMYEIKAPQVLPLEKQSVTESSLAPVEENSDAAQTLAPATDSSKDMAEQKASEATESVADTKQPETVAAKTESSESGSATAGATTTEPAAAAKADPGSTQSTSKTPDKPVSTAKVETQVAKVDAPASKSDDSRKPIVSGYVVQLGSFSVEKNATSLRDKLRSKGYASFVESFERNGKTSYRVRVGPELTPELAEKLKEKLKAETKISGLVMAFPGK